MEKNLNNDVIKISKSKIIIGALIFILVLAVIFVIISSKDKKINIDEKNISKTNTQVVDENIEEEIKYEPISEVLKDTRVEAVGANPISKDNIVLTNSGEIAKNNAPVLSAEAPRQTLAISPKQVSKAALKIDASNTGFSVKEFTVSAGEPVTLAITSIDTYYHVFTFSHPELAAIAVGVDAGETRAITFNAPSKPGEYEFNCDVTCRGGKGKMIVE